MLGCIARFLASCVSYLGRLLFPGRTGPPLEPIPPARVAVVGAGVGGCCAAYFLRQQGGQALDLHVYQRPGSAVGGRAAVVEFCGHTYESGASVIHTSNKYLDDFAKQFGLEMRNEKDRRNIPVGIYDGREFCFLAGTWKLIILIKALWRYGIGLVRMDFLVNSIVKKFSNIYDMQQRGRAFVTVPEMLEAMGGQEMYELTQVSARDHMTDTLGYSERLMREVVTVALRVNYGQGSDINAFATLVAMAGMQDGSLWNVTGGNRRIAEELLTASNSTLCQEEVKSVVRIERDGKIFYSLATESQDNDDVTPEYDAVIVACPLHTSKIQFVNFPSPVYTAAAVTPFQRTVATFVRGEINPAFFNRSGSFPLAVFTTELEGSPFEYRSITVELPSEVPVNQLNEFLRPISEDPVRTWKVFSPEPLTREQNEQMFSRIDDEVTVDWLAYPVYNPPEEFPPFVLDDGVFYINAIEKAASAMEMSAIGGKNAALLARDYLLSQ